MESFWLWGICMLTQVWFWGPLIAPSSSGASSAVRFSSEWSRWDHFTNVWHDFRCTEGTLHPVCPCGPGQATRAQANLSPRTQLLKFFPILLDHRLCHGPKLLRRGGPSSKLSQECWDCVTKQWKAALSPEIIQWFTVEFWNCSNKHTAA